MEARTVMTDYLSHAQKALESTRQTVAQIHAMIADEQYYHMRDWLTNSLEAWDELAVKLEAKVQEESEGIYRMPFMSGTRLRIADAPDGSTHITMIDEPYTDMVMRGMSAEEFRCAALVVYGVREYFRVRR